MKLSLYTVLQCYFNKIRAFEKKRKRKHKLNINTLFKTDSFAYIFYRISDI